MSEENPISLKKYQLAIRTLWQYMHDKLTKDE